MTFKNQAEIYQALLDGVKLATAEDQQYVHLVNGKLIFNDGSEAFFNFVDVNLWYVYEEPKKKVKLYKYAYRLKDSFYRESNFYYKSEHDFCIGNDYAVDVIKLENNYIEVDDE